MAAVTFFDILGVRGEPVPRDAALACWPVGVVQAGVGRQDPPDSAALGLLIEELDASLQFRAIRPGADGERVGLIAELHVGPPLPVQPIALARMPDVEFRLLQTGTTPPTVFITSRAEGTAIVIDALPVEIRLPRRMLMPLEPKPNDPIPLEQVVVAGFQVGFHDTLGITLRRDEPSSIFVHVKVRFTEAREVVIEPAVPLSIGPCRVFGLPCRAVHDLGVVPFPSLAGDPHATEQALEWIRHPLVPLIEDEPTGYVTFRTIDFDDRREPFSNLIKAPNELRAEGQKVEIVLEDLAMPMNSLLFPVPTHVTLGLRRKIGILDDPSSAFDLSGLPVKVHLPQPVDVIGTYLVVEQLLLRSVRLDDPNAGDAQFLFAKMVITDDPAGEGHSATIDVTDEWTLEAGWRYDPGVPLFKLFGVDVRLLGARVGLSFERLTSDTRDYDLEDLFVLVADLELLVNKGSKEVIVMKPNLDKPKVIVVRDFGWRLGSFSIGRFWDPDGADLVAFDVIRLHLDEYGFVSDPNGGRYFALSATLPLGTEAVKPKPGTPASPDKDQFKHAGGGITVHRLRTKIAGDESAPQTLLDGVTLGFREGPVQIVGSGIIADYLADGVRYREFGIGAQVRIDRKKGKDGATSAFTVGASFFYGRANGDAVDFKYVLAAATVSPIPVGPITFSDVRALVAWNLAPTLGGLDAGAAQPMRMFEWYRAHEAALTLPPTRNMSTGGWKPLDESLSIAVGAGIQVGGAKFVTIKAFVMYRKTPEGSGLLAAVEIYPFKAKKPIAYGALEIDGDRWSLLIGVSIGTKNLIGKELPLFKDAPFLTGTFYMTNKPGTIAVGHVNDPSSWLAFHLRGKAWVFHLEMYAGVCLELVDLPEGPRIIAFRVAVSGGTRLLKIGGIDFHLSLSAIVGTWRNESNVSGLVVWFEGGINIDVFWVFDFGANFKVQWDYLGPEPAYRRVAAELRIHTPWWLPDVTFRWNKTFEEPRLDCMRVASTPLIAASARPLARSDALPVAVSPIIGAAIDEAATYSTDDLAQVTGSWPAGALDAIEPVATDATLALSFKATVDDRIAWGQNTPAGMGTQQSRDVSARYTLIELGIRRKPRFSGGAWSTLLDPAASRLDPSLLSLPPEQLPPRFASAVRFLWDADFQREQKLDARQLLVNAETPYGWILFDLEADENLLRTMPGWPCCGPRDKPRWHTLDFRDVPVGTRAAAQQRFSDSTSTLHWLGARPPLVAAGTLVNTDIPVARVDPARRDDAAFARVNFDHYACELRIDIRWRALHLPRRLTVIPFRGLQALPEHSLLLTHEQLAGVSITNAPGITHVLLRLTGERVAADDMGWLELVEMRYRTVEEVLSDLIVQGRCDSPGEATPAGARFAWLANHDYEMRIVTQVAVKDERAGEIVREIPQHVFFRTKGLPGLNTVSRIGEELDPYVESVYPAPSVPVYCGEGVRLAFNERFDMFQAIDRPVQPDDPPERQQTLDYVLCVERIGGRGEPERLSVANPDWIVGHRGTVSPPDARPPKVIDADVLHPIVHRQVRSATSLDPQVMRLEAVLASPFGCGLNTPAARKSRVLAHDPVDLDAPVGAQRWAARAQYRASLRLRTSPFVDRTPFEEGDDTGFLWTGGGTSRTAEGALEIVAGPGGYRYGSFGELTWDHFTLRTRLRIQSGVAGVALGLQGPAVTAGACLVRLDSAAGKLQIIERVTGSEHVLRDVAIEPPEDGLWNLRIDSYDDAWRVQSGAVDELVPKSAGRRGRVALLASGTALFDSLVVDGIEAFRFEFQASRWLNFKAHVESFDRRVKAMPELAAPSQSVADFAAALAQSAPLSDGLEAQRRFDDWTAALCVALTERVERLEIAARSGAQGVSLLLIESPEPFAIGEEVTMTIWRKQSGSEVRCDHLALLDASRSRALIVPIALPTAATELTRGSYRLQFALRRPRYRASGSDADSLLFDEHSVEFDL